jgi:hypothetical protein
MSNDDSIRVQRNENIVWRIIDDEVVVLVPENNTLHALGGCGDRVWELIEKETTISEIVNVICDEYEVEPERARKDITQFVHKLKGLKLARFLNESGEEDGH